MDQPLVSVLIPAKDESLFVEACLDSISSQSYQNWEAIIVDDGSKDNTYDLVSAYALKDSRISCYRNEKSGIIPALRLALTKAEGTLISRMDADDLMHVDKLKVLSQLLVNHGRGNIATAQVKYFSEGRLGEGYKNYEQWLNDLCLQNKHYSEIYKECPIASPNWLMYREDLEKIGAFNNDVYPEDYDLVFRCYTHQLTVISVDSLSHYWRDYPTRSSRTQENYSDNRFLNLKMYYFLKLDYKESKELILWGAAAKGKAIAKILLENKVPFRWICNNKNKHGHDIYGVKMEDSVRCIFTEQTQVIIAVAQKNAQQNILERLQKEKLKAGSSYFLFC